MNEKTPNNDIDTAFKTLLKKVKNDYDASMPLDMKIKILHEAILWEKTKHHIRDADNDFNPENIT